MCRYLLVAAIGAGLTLTGSAFAESDVRSSPSKKARVSASTSWMDQYEKQANGGVAPKKTNSTAKSFPVTSAPKFPAPVASHAITKNSPPAAAFHGGNGNGNGNGQPPSTPPSAPPSSPPVGYSCACSGTVVYSGCCCHTPSCCSCHTYVSSSCCSCSSYVSSCCYTPSCCSYVSSCCYTPSCCSYTSYVASCCYTPSCCSYVSSCCYTPSCCSSDSYYVWRSGVRSGNGSSPPTK